jgi:hypothetical protein
MPLGIFQQGGHTMSHTSKKPNPEPEVGLEASEQTLISEYKRLDSMLAAINAKMREESQTILEAQQRVQAYREQGLQFVGQANVVGRLLQGMGIDPQTLTGELANLELIDPEGVEGTPAAPENPSARKPGLKNRFPVK